MVQKAVGSHSYELNTLPKMHNVFYSQLLRLIKVAMLLGQLLMNMRPPTQMVDGDLEYTVDEILNKKGKGRSAHCLVKWTSY
jgi:hypothetical protein